MPNGKRLSHILTSYATTNGDKRQLVNAVLYMTKTGCRWRMLPKCWIVEQTFAWLGWSGRLAKDFEQTNLSAENFVKLGYISQMLKFIK